MYCDTRKSPSLPLGERERWLQDCIQDSEEMNRMQQVIEGTSGMYLPDGGVRTGDILE
jgi:hypothetical protein